MADTLSAASYARRIVALADRDPRRAVPPAQRWLAHTTEAPPLVRAWAHYALGWAVLRWERFEAAGPLLAAAEQLFTMHGQPGAALDGRFARLLLALLRGAGPELQAAWESLAADYHLAGDPAGAARAGIQQAAHLNILGQTPQALALAHRIAPLVETHGTPGDLARLRRVLAVAHRNAGQLDDADQLLDQAMAGFQALRSPLEVARCLSERALNLQRRERLAEAHALLEQLRPQVRRMDLPMFAAILARNRGSLLDALGQYDQALADLGQARAGLLALGRHDLAASCDLEVGNVAYFCGLYDLAAACYTRTATAFEALGRPRWALFARRNAAMAHHQDGQLALALHLIETLAPQAAALGDALEGAEIAAARGRALHRLGDRQGARAALEAAYRQFEQLGNQGAAAETLLDQAELLLDDQQPEAAAPLADQAAQALQDSPSRRWRAEYALGRCLRAQGRQAEARDALTRACATVAGLRGRLTSEFASSGIYRQARHLVDEALELAMAAGDIPAIVALASQQHGLALRHQLRAPRLAVRPDQQQLLASRRAAVQAATRAAEPQALDQALAGYLDVLLPTRLHAPGAGVDGPPGDLATLRVQLQARWGTGWTALVYVPMPAALLIVCLTPTEEHATALPLDRALQRLLRHVTDPAYQALTYLDAQWQPGAGAPRWQTLAALGERLVPAVARARLHPGHRLLVVPAGSLHAVPWAALRVDGAWLCTQSVVHVSPSPGLWSQLAERRVPSAAALLIGCSTVPRRPELPDLPNVAAELDDIAATWPGPVERWQDAGATCARLLALEHPGEARRFGLIHVASHAQLLAARGVLAHLALWDDDLFWADLSRIQLDGALVVLSVCQGGAAEHLPGEELIGLQHALLVAGARGIIASLWPIYDRATQPLLRPLYAALAGGVDAASALATAQRTLIAQCREDDPRSLLQHGPLVWGGWTVIGDQ